MLPEIPDNDGAFARARRNLVLMSTFLLVYCSGTISFTANNAFIGFAIKIEDVFMLHAWCGVFLAYFFWRFYTAGGGGQMIKAFGEAFEAQLLRLLENHAFNKRNKDKDLGKITKEYFLKVGEIYGVPVIGYAPTGIAGHERITAKKDYKTKERYLYYPGFLKYWLMRSYVFIREIIGSNQFTELILPWFLALTAAGALFWKIQTY